MEYRRNSLVLNRQHQTITKSHPYPSFACVASPRNKYGQLFETSTMWWDEQRIQATVTRQFVLSKLRPDEQVRLDEHLGFGDGLTDDTYIEWIELKAKRIFLILDELGVPDQIFGVVDDSWDDDDLPIPLDQIGRLKLTYAKDEKLEKKFFHRQFYYLLRNIQKGEQIYYDDGEIIPLELAEKRPVGTLANVSSTNVDKVHIPGNPDFLLLRSRIPLGSINGRVPREEFLSRVAAYKAIEHSHLRSLWASYIHQDCGYLLLTPVNDCTLKSFLAATPQSVKILAKQDRRILMLNWIHCLANALAFLHGQGLAHQNIKPSTVVLGSNNHIFFDDLGIFPTLTLETEKLGFDREAYDFAAPEQGQRLPMIFQNTRPRGLSRSSSDSVYSFRCPSFDTASYYSTSTSSNGSLLSNSPPPTPNLPIKHDPQKSDIFSLGAIFLEILTFLLKRTSRNFASHRSARNKTLGRVGALPDSSFHNNLGQVEIWVATLLNDSSKKEDKIFRGASQIISVVSQMVSVNPEERPTASEVKTHIYSILLEQCDFGRTDELPSKIHCEPHVLEEQQHFSFEELCLASQRAAAEACANVNPVTANGGTLGVNGGVIYGAERAHSVVSKIGIGVATDTDSASFMTRRQSNEGRGAGLGVGSDSGAFPVAKTKPKAKAWQAPVYAGTSSPATATGNTNIRLQN